MAVGIKFTILSKYVMKLTLSRFAIAENSCLDWLHVLQKVLSSAQ